MTTDKFEWSSQLKKVEQKFFDLNIKTIDGKTAIKGILDIPDDSGNVIGSFSIELLHHKNYPFRFPQLYEVGGDIPNHNDWHKYETGQCCITVLPDEVLKCKSGIEVTYFIDHYAIPYFANQIYKRITGHYKNGEYGHGIVGLQEFYTDLFKTKEYSLWYELVQIAYQNYDSIYGRNLACFCGSNLKFKNCHRKVFLDIQIIGKDQVLNDIKRITQ